MFRIKEIMQEKGITNVELSRRMGMTPVSISYIVTGKTEPNITKLNEIAKALEVEMWELFASRDEIIGDKDFIAFVRSRGRTFEAMSLDELEMVVDSLRKGV